MKAKLLERSEYEECVALVEYLNILKRQRKIITYTHIPNETFTVSWNQKRKNKAMGVSSGFPDYVILGQKIIVFLEMKREKGGTTSSQQKLWIEDLSRYSNASARVCSGFREAEGYLKSVLG